jgi:hypothetical protein
VVVGDIVPVPGVPFEGTPASASAAPPTNVSATPFRACHPATAISTGAPLSALTAVRVSVRLAGVPVGARNEPGLSEVLV